MTAQTAQAARSLVEALRGVNRWLVYVAITPFGQDGPYAHHLASDLTLAAMGGMMALNGEADRPPVRGEWCSEPIAFGHEPERLDLAGCDQLSMAFRQAWEATELLFRTAGTTAAKDGQRMQRYFRDLAMARTQFAAQYDRTSEWLARDWFGIPRWQA